MKKEMLGELLIHALKKYNFKNYGSKLFYLELEDSIIILEQTNYRGCAEMYLSIIIKECHPEISKITMVSHEKFTSVGWMILSTEDLTRSQPMSKIMAATTKPDRYSILA